MPQNSISSSIYSTQSSKLLSPILRQHTVITFFSSKHPRSILNSKSHSTGNFTSLLTQSASSKLGASFSPPHSCYPYTRALSALVWSMHLKYGGARRTPLSWIQWNLRLFVSSILPLSRTVFSLLKSAAMLLLFLSFIVIFTLTTLQNLLTPCLPTSRGLDALAYSLNLYSPNPLCTS